MTHPFALQKSRLSPDLARVLAYWKGLRRGEADMPFWDDARLTDLPDLSDRLMLLDVFDKPERFRFDMVGGALGANDLPGRFLDETPSAWPLDFLRAQASATVECGEPTYYRHDAGNAEPVYGRLLIPMWGDGRISMILAVQDLG